MNDKGIFEMYSLINKIKLLNISKFMKKLVLFFVSIFLLFFISNVNASNIIIVNDNLNNLLELNIDTGEKKLIGKLDTLEIFTDIAIHPNGELYGITFNSLYKIDIITAKTTFIWLHGIPEWNALTFSSDWTLFAASATTTNLYVINLVNGSSIYFGDLWVSSEGDIELYNSIFYVIWTNGHLISIRPEYFTDVWTLWVDNIYGLVATIDWLIWISWNSIYSINTDTGLATFIKSIDWLNPVWWATSFFPHIPLDPIINPSNLLSIFNPPSSSIVSTWNWDETQNIDWYKIYRNIDWKVYSFIDSVPEIFGKVYQDSDISYWHLYCYKITAFKWINESDFSNEYCDRFEEKEEDFCPNIDWIQVELPIGYSYIDWECILDSFPLITTNVDAPNWFNDVLLSWWSSMSIFGWKDWVLFGWISYSGNSYVWDNFQPVNEDIPNGTYHLCSTNVSDCSDIGSFIINNTVNNKPVITLIGDSTINLNIGDSFVDTGAISFDIEDWTWSIIYSKDVVDTSSTWTYVLSYSFMDSDFSEADVIERSINIIEQLPECSDWIDNDWDGNIDTNDLWCHNNWYIISANSYEKDRNIENYDNNIGKLLKRYNVLINENDLVNENLFDEVSYFYEEADKDKIWIMFGIWWLVWGKILNLIDTNVTKSFSKLIKLDTNTLLINNDAVISLFDEFLLRNNSTKTIVNSILFEGLLYLEEAWFKGELTKWNYLFRDIHLYNYKEKMKRANNMFDDILSNINKISIDKRIDSNLIEWYNYDFSRRSIANYYLQGYYSRKVDYLSIISDYNDDKWFFTSDIILAASKIIWSTALVTYQVGYLATIDSITDILTQSASLKLNLERYELGMKSFDITGTYLSNVDNEFENIFGAIHKNIQNGLDNISNIKLPNSAFGSLKIISNTWKDYELEINNDWLNNTDFQIIVETSIKIEIKSIKIFWVNLWTWSYDVPITYTYFNEWKEIWWWEKFIIKGDLIANSTFKLIAKNNDGLYWLGSIIMNSDGHSIEKVEGWIAKPLNKFYEFIRIKSPGELRVYNENWWVTWLVNGTIIEEISDSYYSDDWHYILLFNSKGNNTYEIAGNDNWTYWLDIIINRNWDFIKFNFSNILISKGEIHNINIIWNYNNSSALFQIDKNWDGIPEKTFEINNNSMDVESPKTIISLNSNDWINHDSEIILTAHDNQSWVGIRETKYSLDNWNTWISYINPFIISKEWINTIQFYSVDWFWNIEETKYQEIKIDKTPPEVKIFPYISDVGIEISWTDNLSEVTVKKINNRKYLLKDEAGNTTKIVVDGYNIGKSKNFKNNNYFKKWYRKLSNYKKRKLLKSIIKIKSIQYNNDKKIRLSNNYMSFNWKKTKKDLIILKNQTTYIFKYLRFFAKYNDKKNQTQILIKEKGKAKKEILDWLKILYFETNNGILNSWY